MSKVESTNAKTVKTTVYLPDGLRREVKKHLIDTGETMSAFTAMALQKQLEFDNSRAGRKRLEEKSKVERLNDVIRGLAKDQ